MSNLVMYVNLESSLEFVIILQNCFTLCTKWTYYQSIFTVVFGFY